MTYWAIQRIIGASAVAAWIAFAALPILYSQFSSVASASSSPYVCQIVVDSLTGGGTSAALAFGLTAASGLIMAVAMMAPASLPAVRFVATNSLKNMRVLSTTLFLSSYLSVWVVFAVVVAAAGAAAATYLPVGAIGIEALPIVLLMAAVWQVTPMKRIAMRACHYGPMLPVTGRRAIAAYVGFGLRYGISCLGSCWLLMLAMYTARESVLFWMLIVSGVIWAERMLPRRPALYRTTGLGLGVFAFAALAI